MKWVAGSACPTACTTAGALRRSNTKPESIIEGRKLVSSAIWLAWNWLRVRPEMNSPISSDTVRYSMPASTISASDPRIGTSNRKCAASRHMARSMAPTTSHGASLASTISSGRTGVTNSDSSVPRSHSRAISSEVRKAPIIVSTITSSPGTRNHVLSPASLNQVRDTTDALPTAAAAALPVSSRAARSACFCACSASAPLM